MEYMGIRIDLSRDNLFDELGIKRLKDSYMKEDEQSPQQRFAYVSKMFSSNEDHAQRLYDYASRHWLSYSTPILSFGRSKRGLPISCFLNFIEEISAWRLVFWNSIHQEVAFLGIRNSFWTSFHSFSSLTLGICLEEGFYVPDPCELTFANTLLGKDSEC